MPTQLPEASRTRNEVAGCGIEHEQMLQLSIFVISDQRCDASREHLRFTELRHASKYTSVADDATRRGTYGFQGDRKLCGRNDEREPFKMLTARQLLLRDER